MSKQAGINSGIPLEADFKKIALLENSVKDFLESHDDQVSRSFFSSLKPKPYHFIYPPIWRVALRNLFPFRAMMPDFVCSGAVQSMDDLLSHYVMQHPCVALPLSKDLSPFPVYTKKFIDSQLASEKQGRQLARRYGLSKSGIFYSVQPSTSWIYWLKALNPEMRFVLCLRNPVDRVFDHWAWNQMMAAGLMNDPLWEELPDLAGTISMELRQIPRGGNGMNFFVGVGASGYLRQSIYLPFLKELHKVFGKQAVLLVDAENLTKDHEGVMRQVYEFLSLPDYSPVKLENRGEPIESFRDLEGEREMRQDLIEFFKPYNTSLFEYLGKSFDWT